MRFPNVSAIPMSVRSERKCPLFFQGRRQHITLTDWELVNPFEYLFINGVGGYEKGKDYFAGKTHLVWLPGRYFRLTLGDHLCFMHNGYKTFPKILQIKDVKRGCNPGKRS